MKKFAVLAMEAVQFQKPVFFDELVLTFKEIRGLSDADYTARAKDYDARLSAIVNHHTESAATVSFGPHAAGCYIFDPRANHVLARKENYDYIAEHTRFVERFMRDYSAGRKSMVNIGTGKLSGLFSDLPYVILFPVKLVRTSIQNQFTLTVEELAAVFLHEVGHYFTYCEYFSRTVKTNQALAEVSKAMDGSYDVQQRELRIGMIGSKLQLKGLDAKALAAVNDQRIVEVAILSEASIQSRNELGISIYDENACEFLSDQYAVRMGAGRYLITGMDKMNRSYGVVVDYQSTPSFMWSQFAQIMLGVLIPPVMVLFFWGGTLQANENVYDDPETRWRRMKQEMTAQLKNRSLSTEDKKRIVEDIRIVEEVTKDVEHKRTVWQTIVELVAPLYRKNRQSTQLQKQLETLANNSLYVSAAELTTLQQTTSPKE